MNAFIYNFPLFECLEVIGVQFLLNFMLHLMKMLTPFKTLSSLLVNLSPCPDAVWLTSQFSVCVFLNYHLNI